jgi:hypothetical protein
MKRFEKGVNVRNAGSKLSMYMCMDGISGNECNISEFDSKFEIPRRKFYNLVSHKTTILNNRIGELK